MRTITRFAALLFAASMLHLASFGQTANAPVTVRAEVDQVSEKMLKSVVLILTGKGDGQLERTASGVIVRPNGVILTAYHVVKDASQVQVRLGNGEIYDRVDLLGYDERRDVAALKIAAADLPAVEIRTEEAPAGSRILTLSNPKGVKWTVTSGIMNTTSLADNVPNAGTGFRVAQFTAPLAGGSNAGLLADDLGRAIGLIVATETYAQNLNYAVPMQSVLGLGDSTQSAMSFGRGAALDLPKPPRPPSAAELVSTDPDEILRNAKLFAVTSRSTTITDKMMENGLLRRPDFRKWKLVLIDDPKLADVIIDVKHILFTWEYRYTMYDRRTNIILGNGKIIEWESRPRPVASPKKSSPSSARSRKDRPPNSLLV